MSRQTMSRLPELLVRFGAVLFTVPVVLMMLAWDPSAWLRAVAIWLTAALGASGYGRLVFRASKGGLSRCGTR